MREFIVFVKSAYQSEIASFNNSTLDLIFNGLLIPCRWLWRQRIRVISSGKYLHDRPLELQEQLLRFPEHRYFEHVGEHEQLCKPTRVYPSQPPRVLPVRALNEVFIGESLSARFVARVFSYP